MKFGHEILKYKEDILRDLKEFLAIPSVCAQPLPGKPFGEESARALEFILNTAKKLGLDTVNVDNFAGDARYGTGNDFVDVLTHVDVVPAGDGWSYEPYTLTEEDGYLYGRGVADDKGPAIISLYCLKALKDANIQGKHIIRTVFGCGEEIGSNDLDVYYEKQPFPVMGFTPDCSYGICHCEKGILRVDFLAEEQPGTVLKSFHAGTVVNAVPASASAALLCTPVQLQQLKNAASSATFTITELDDTVIVQAKGKAAHGAEPHLGCNAAALLLSLLSKVFRRQELGSLASFLIDYIHTEYNGTSLGIQMQDEPSGELTLNLGIVEINEQQSKASLDIRYPATRSEHEIMPLLINQAAPYHVQVQTAGHNAPLYIPKDAPLISLLQDAYFSAVGENCNVFSTGGGTYARHTPNRVVAFGPVFSSEPPTNAHNCDENINIEKLFLHAQICLEAMYQMFTR